MEFISYSLTALVAFLGVYAGAALAFIAPEEMKTGRKYFLWIEKILLLLLVVFLLNHLSIHLLLRSVIYVLLIGLLMIKELNNRRIYPILAIIFFLSAASQNLLFKQAVLIFLYGLPAGSLFVNVKNKKFAVAKKLLVNYASFTVIALLLFWIF